MYEILDASHHAGDEGAGPHGALGIGYDEGISSTKPQIVENKF